MRKPTICICENKGADQLRSNCEADQRLCFRYTYSTFLLLSKYDLPVSSVLGVSDLFGIHTVFPRGGSDGFFPRNKSKFLIKSSQDFNQTRICSLID